MVNKGIVVLALVGLLLAGYLVSQWLQSTGTPILPPASNATATPTNATASPTASSSPEASVSLQASSTPLPSVSPTPPPLPLPNVSNINVTVNGTTANFTWASSLPGYSVLEYGVTNALGEKASLEQTNSTHSLSLQNLSPKTTYYYKVGACAPHGCGYSDLQSFTTPRKTCASGMSYFDEKDFCMDRYEAAVDAITRLPVTASGKFPWIIVSYAEASRACTSVGKRLCTSEEFTFACNIAGKKEGPIGSSCQLQGQSFNKTGETDCTSKEGVHDQIGNVGEWVSDLATSDTPYASGFTATDQNPLTLGATYEFPRAMDAKTEKFGNDYYTSLVSSSSLMIGTGVLRGGDYTLGGQAGCFAFQVGVPLDTKTDKIGFRCCS